MPRFYRRVMKTRTLGPLGWTTSPLGLGCMGMSQGYGPPDDARSLATFDAAIDSGITLWDTAQSYGAGHNEHLVGQALRGRRQRIQLATKVGISRSAEGVRLDARPETIRASCEASLDRLGVEHIDLYYVHRFDPEVPVEDTIGAMAELVAAGKIGHVGVSECSAEQLARAAATHPITALQCEWSLWWREAEDQVIPAARRLGVALIPYSPLGRGFLTAEALPDSFAAGDFRNGDGRFVGAERSRNQAVLEQFRALAGRLAVTTGQLALAWLLAQGDDVVPIPGMRRPERVAENARAAEIALNPADIAEIEAIAGRQAWAGDRRSFQAHGLTRGRT